MESINDPGTKEKLLKHQMYHQWGDWFFLFVTAWKSNQSCSFLRISTAHFKLPGIQSVFFYLRTYREFVLTNVSCPHNFKYTYVGDLTTSSSSIFYKILLCLSSSMKTLWQPWVLPCTPIKEFGGHQLQYGSGVQCTDFCLAVKT